MFYAILLPGKDFLQDEKWKPLLKLTSQLHSSKKKKEIQCIDWEYIFVTLITGKGLP